MSRTAPRTTSNRLRSSPTDVMYKRTAAEPLELYGKMQDAQIQHKPRVDSLTRPRTSSGGSKETKPNHQRYVPITINPHGYDYAQPKQHSMNAYYLASPEDVGVIGMALGSPTHANAPKSFPIVPDEKGSRSRMATIINSDLVEDEPSPKPKISRWKSIFGRKPMEQSPQHSVYTTLPARSQRQNFGSEVDMHAAFKTPSPAASPALGEVDELWGRQKSTKKRMADRKESSPKVAQLMPLVLDQHHRAGPIQQAQESPLPPPKDFLSRQIPQVTVSNDSGAFSPTSPPLLNIDMPKIEMERYSVMFSGILANNRNSSLLVRRQGNADKLQPLDERSLNTSSANFRPQRRATSPTVRKPSLSLFPSPLDDSRPYLERSISTVHRPRPLQRSHTAPKRLSPGRPSFDYSDGYISEGPSTAGLSTPGLSAYSPAEPETATTPFSVKELSIKKKMQPTSQPRQEPWQTPALEEPAWEIMSRLKESGSPVKTSPSHAPSRPAAPARTSTMHIVAASPSAQVGIARQVSVTRPARTVDIVKRKPSLPPERLVAGERKPLTPTLVELKNRKSHRVQIVEA